MKEECDDKTASRSKRLDSRYRWGRRRRDRRLYGRQVVAIDNRQEELDEAPGGFEKILMDARHLTFEDASFDYVTFFYSLMFMDAETQKQALAEAFVC